MTRTNSNPSVPEKLMFPKTALLGQFRLPRKNDEVLSLKTVLFEANKPCILGASFVY